MEKHTSERLGIEYIFGRLAAEVYAPGAMPRRWEYPKTIQSEDLIPDFIDVIPQALGFKGREVSLVVATSSMQYSLVKSFPMRERDLVKYINHKASLAWGKDIPHLVGWSTLPWEIPQTGKKELFIHTYIMPTSYSKILLDFCRKFSFQPAHVFTAASLAPDFHDLLPQPQEGLNLIAVTTGDSTLVILGKKKEPYLIRELPYTWNSGDAATIDRIAREIQRTILFTKQQFNSQIAIIGLVGKGAEEIRTAVGEQAKVPVTAIDGDVPWIACAINSPKKRSENLIPKEMLDYSKRKKFARVLFFSLLIMLIVASLAELGVSHRLVQIENILKREKVAENIQALTARQTLLQQQILTESNLESVMKEIAIGQFDPVPGWFAGFAVDKLPGELYLSNVKIDREPDSGTWAVSIEGYAPRNPVRASVVLSLYQSALSNPDTILTIETPWHIQWVENLKYGSSEDPERKGKPFRIQGRIR